jgi:uncharacterized protein YqgV (UPF0045/DUF77 family)
MKTIKTIMNEMNRSRKDSGMNEVFDELNDVLKMIKELEDLIADKLTKDLKFYERGEEERNIEKYIKNIRKSITEIKYSGLENIRAFIQDLESDLEAHRKD